MEAPVKFVQDGPDAETQIRQCGVPIQHRLSDALSEAVLFCLDFAVNKSTESNLYRMHDDLWFCGSTSAAEAAWQTIKGFAGAMGLSLNHGKTGAVEVASKSVEDRRTSPSGLPLGDNHLGFLEIRLRR